MDDESHRIRVKFENYGFFVPKDTSGQPARLEGKFVRETLSKQVVDHLIDDGATLAYRVPKITQWFSSSVLVELGC